MLAALRRGDPQDVLPQARTLVPEPAAGDGVLGVHAAGEGDDACVLGQAQREYPIQREGVHALVAEVPHPRARDERDAAGRMAPDEALLVAVGVGNALRVGAELLLQREELVHREAEYRGLPEPLEGLGRVARQDHLVGVAVAEELVQAAGDDEVQVEEQHRPAERAQRAPPQQRLGPDALGVHRHGHVQRRQRLAIHLGAHAGGVVGEAGEGKRRREVARHHRVEAVDEARPVLRAPVEQMICLFMRCQCGVLQADCPRDSLACASTPGRCNGAWG
jgi:hypothetical protein